MIPPEASRYTHKSVQHLICRQHCYSADLAYDRELELGTQVISLGQVKITPGYPYESWVSS